MNPPHMDPEDDDQEEVFLDESDIVQEIPIDEEDLPEADDDDHGSDSDGSDGPDDSVHIFTGHTDELYTVACSPVDASLVATGGKDDRGFMWRIGVGDWASELKDHRDSVTNLAFSSDGMLLASGSYDGTVKIWDVSSQNCTCTLEGPNEEHGVEWVKWHPKGHLLLAGAGDGTAWLWNADKGAYLNVFSGHAASVTCGDFTPDGKTICTGSEDATLRIWNPRTGENIHVFRDYPYHTDGLTCLAVSSDSTLALTGSKDNSVHIANISTGRVACSLPAHTDSVECVGFAPSGQWAATGSMDQKLIIWDLQHQSPRNTCDHEDGVTCLLWLGNGRFVATGCSDGKIRLWDCLSGDCFKTFNGHSDVVQSLGISADGNYLVSVSMDHSARVFEIADFKRAGIFEKTGTA